MIFLWIFPGVLLLLLLLFFFMTAPKRGHMPADVRYYAHRGLHNGADIPENTLPAFARATEAGYGIELDVQLSKDGEAVVFHDHSLARVCGVEGFVEDYTVKELAQMKPLGQADVGGVPTLKEVLAHIDGRVPLIVEIKADTKDYPQTVELTLKLLHDYKGAFSIESFHPHVLRLVRKADSRICRGQLCDCYRATGGKRLPVSMRLAKWFLFNALSRPHFIAYNFKNKNRLPLRMMRLLYPKCVYVAWTPASEADNAECLDFDVSIFEHTTPVQGPMKRSPSK